MRALLSTAVVVGLFAAAAVYFFDRLVVKPKAESLRDSLADIPRITLPWGSIPTGVH
jgi:hypothetical protein